MTDLTGLLQRRGLLKLLGLAAALSLLGTPAWAQTPKKLEIVATTGMVADALRQVGGERVNVEALMGPVRAGLSRFWSTARW